MKVPFLDLKAHHAPLRAEFDAAIGEVIDSGAFAGGPFVANFEKDFAAYCDCRHAIGVGSGTEALWLALLALASEPATRSSLCRAPSWRRRRRSPIAERLRSSSMSTNAPTRWIRQAWREP